MSRLLESVPALALCTGIYEGLTLTDALPRIAACGIASVCIQADAPHFFPNDWPLGRLHQLRARLQATGVRVAALRAETGRSFFTPVPAGPVYEPSLVTPQAAGRRLRIHHLQRCLESAHLLGAEVVAVCSGVCLPGTTPRDARARLLDGLSIVLSHAAEVGVRVALTPRPGQLVASHHDALSVLEALPHPLLGVGLDLAELAFRGPSPLAAIFACSGRIWSVQATDSRRESPYRLLPGQGEVPLPAMLAALEQVGYTAPLVLQLENELACPEAAIAEALRFFAGSRLLGHGLAS